LYYFKGTVREQRRRTAKLEEETVRESE